MKIRLHLVRFMYINLLLSCCFWLYDNAAAADAATTTTTKENAYEAAVNQANSQTHIPVASLASGEGAVNEEKVASSLRTNFIKLTTRQNADNIVMKKMGNAPRTTTSAKITKPPEAAIDTSVNLDALPPSVNNNNNYDKEFISIVHHSENDNNNNNADNEATAQVPKNQFNNKVNSNINTNANANEQLQQPKYVVDATTTSPDQEQQQQQHQQQNEKESLPKIIPELPAVTITAELPVEVEHVKDRLETVLLPSAPSQDASNQSETQPSPAVESAEKVARKAELKINDPGGGVELSGELTAEADVNVTGDTVAPATNATAEEVPMPVFSEWAQKQMEAEASREQAMELEQQVVNNSAQRRNATGSGSGKQPSLKSRAKNYASPDCGAKIIASNGDATNTGAVLSHSSDEYMLSTCGSRIWFVVELCEAVQAQKVELANFELFSSSPKNFTVAVSKRFPTRDWSNVGRFTAEDKRTVQTFELHPHLFGKFVRVDIHSHYSKEHFCPISLFRVFGTSEFEAFETEIRHSDELDDFDDDFAGQEQPHKTMQGNGNIFQSASDAVIQMVKKAAQVLVKPTKLLRSPESLHCYTPTAGIYSCQSCNSSIVERINNLLSCQPDQLQLLLLLPQLRTHLLRTRVCQDEYNISFGSAKMEAQEACSGMDKRQSFYLSMLPAEHVGAMCKLLQAEYNTITVGQPVVLPQATTGQKQQQHLNVPEQLSENVTTADRTKESKDDELRSLPAATPSLEKVHAEIPLADKQAANDARQDPLVPIDAPPSDVNIFNVPKDTQKDATTTGSTESNVSETPNPMPVPPVADKEVELASSTEGTLSTSQPAPTVATTVELESGDLVGSGNGLDDANLVNWESIDSLLTTTVASITAGGGAAAAVVNGNAHIGGTASAAAGAAAVAANAGGMNMQPKLTNGAQSESVFIRLSNRIKALERNMSLSGQYLEELSRRYKKQVEELQQTLTQQTLTVRTLEEQSRRYIEQEQLYQQQSAELAGDVRSLTYQVQACILVIIIVGTCIFLMLVMGTVYYRKLRHQNQQLQPVATSPTSSKLTKQKLSRRKSYEQMMQHQSPGKQRRPSEEAMLILNGCGDVTSAEAATEVANGGGRQRKISVCYGSNNNIAGNMLNTRTSLHRRKGAKQSWHTSLDSAQVACAEHLDKFFDVDTLKNNKLATKAAKKKSQQLHQQELKRQESAPANCTQNSLAEEEPTQSDFDESLMLDDEDLRNFIPNSDLAYNEFMPEGPSGYQIVDTVDGKSDKSTKKSRRVSSPAFFKSPFSKSKNKGGHFNGIGGVKGSQSAHEATSWEWYRLRRSEKNSKQSSAPSVSVTPNASLDSSSLSEINFPFNSTQNSFRILGEAIMSSGETKAAGRNSTGAAGSSSSSSASTTSSTTKKKQRAFNNIFRKVF